MSTPAPTPQPLFTLGHSNHALDALLDLLCAHGVATVVDVRSNPYSRFHPQYRRDAFRDGLERAGLGYVFLGRELGARSDDPACLVDGRVSYARLALTPGFRAGLARLGRLAGAARVAIVCAERDPLTCHRMVLVCRALLSTPSADRFAVGHIHADGRLEGNGDAERRLLVETGLDGGDLFRASGDALSEAYRRRAADLEWTPQPGRRPRRGGVDSS